MTCLPGYPCAVCRRASNGTTVSIPNQPLASFCGSDCARIFMTKAKPSEGIEAKAITRGGQEAGAFLDRIGKTDLAALSGAEWTEFCTIMWTETCAELARITDDEIPF